MLGHGALRHDGVHGGELLEGLVHPLVGLDHLVVMVLVGLVAVASAARLAVWLAPAAFIGAMAIGGLVGAHGLSGGTVEALVVASVAATLVLAWRVERVALAALVAVVAGVGLVHGAAHGAAIAAAADPLAFAAGVFAATAALHLLGALGGVRLARWRAAGEPTATGGPAIAE